MDIQTPHSKNADPITSHIAGEKITKSGKRHTQQIQVAKMVAEKEGLTSAELAVAFKANRPMIARCLSESMLLVRGEHRKCRINGSQAVTWWLR